MKDNLIIPKEYAWHALEQVIEYGSCLIVHDGEGLACFGNEPKDGEFVAGMLLLAPTFSEQLNSLAAMMKEGMAMRVSLFDADGTNPVVQFVLGEWEWDEDEDEEDGPFTCRLCGGIEDGEGYDGMCGACADKECADAEGEEQEQQDDFKTQDEVWAELSRRQKLELERRRELYLRDYIASLDEKDNTDA